MGLTKLFCALLLGVAAWVGAQRAEAAELQVISAGAMRSIVTELAAAFEKETGHTVKLTFGTVGVIKAKLAEATPVDVVIMTDEAMRDMTRQGAVVEGSWTPIGRTGIGHQISEIIPVKGVTLVGPLPKELQKTTVYAAGVTVGSASRTTAGAFVAFLARPDFKPKLAAAGLDYKE